MSDVPKTIRAVYDHGVLRPLDPVDLPENRQVTLIVVEDDVPVEALACAAVSGGAFDFLKDEAEDVYSAEDGEPV